MGEILRLFLIVKKCMGFSFDRVLWEFFYLD